jgi:hypothetical protein
VIALAILNGATAQASEFVRADCRDVVRSSTSLHFESHVHFDWYRRFWTGDCQNLGLACIPGSPNWNDIVTQVLEKTEPGERAAILARVCQMGQTVGFEWARPKPVRRLDTVDLFSFGQIIRKAHRPAEGLDTIEIRVRKALNASQGS